jgi:DNA (cytosine-5)-methyltransferase 1
MKFIDIFAGIGGFRMGFEAAGHECVGYIEIDKFARRSYEAIFDTTGEWTATDIRAVEPSDLPDADIYTFGFPCQSFSIAGKRGGFEDARGTLIFEVLRLAKIRKPLYLVGENVKDLLNHDKGKTFGHIISAMDEMGYDVEWQVLDSQNYGIPHHRERVYIIGHLRTGCTREVLPILGGDGEADGVRRDTTNTLTARYGAAQSTGSYIVESQ